MVFNGNYPLKNMMLCGFSGKMLKKMELQRFSLCCFKTTSVLSLFLSQLLDRELFEDK